MSFSQWERLKAISEGLSGLARVEDLGEVRRGNLVFPLRTLTLGSSDPKAPCFGMVGGVHGLEVIGTEVVLAFLEGLTARLKWDVTLAHQLERARWSFLPVMNPIGMALGRRSNGNGVDLMRNAPVDAEERALTLVGGHRIGSWLPWYRGRMGAPLERESQLLVEWVEKNFFGSSLSVVLDVHSGFGLRDRLWYPFAKTRRPYPYLDQTLELQRCLNSSLPHHVYVFQNQAELYRTHGDLWDHLVDRAPRGKVFIPLTLEMGSWLWVRKNPLQIFSSLGIYNPIKAHRRRRTLRRHLPLLDFLTRYILLGLS